MRTTLNIDDDVLNLAKSLAYDRKISVGDALSELARRGMNPPIQLERDPETGFLRLPRGSGSPQITLEDIKRAEEEDDLERYQRSLRVGSRPAASETNSEQVKQKKANDKR